MLKHFYTKKASVVFLFLILSLSLLLLLADNSKKPVCTDYTLILPEGYDLQYDDKNRDSLFLRSGDIVGGVLHCPFSRGIFGTADAPQLHPLNRLRTEILIKTLKAADAPGTTPSLFDYMDYSMSGQGPVYSAEASFINRSAEYKHYMLFFDDGVLTLWFDTSLADAETIQAIAANFSAVP